MKIFSANQIKAIEKLTLINSRITDLELMEVAATNAVKVLLENYNAVNKFYIFCGKGNNGGDGLAMARILNEKSLDVTVFVSPKSLKFSANAKINFNRLEAREGLTILDFEAIENFKFSNDSIIIDAIFGIGINKKISGKYKLLIKYINKLPSIKIALDLPSGLFPDCVTPDSDIVFKADLTLSFNFWKKSFFYPESGKYCGKIAIVYFGISADIIEEIYSADFVIDAKTVSSIYKPRDTFSHKGTHGSSVIIAGSYGKIGAAVLATKAALRAGSGLTFCVVPQCGNIILQSAVPEAMFIKSGETHLKYINVPENAVYAAGPGLGTDAETHKAIISFLKAQSIPVILDADALNIIASNKDFLKIIPTNSIITPHPKEFERLFGRTDNSFDRSDLAVEMAKNYKIYIVLKDHHTQIVTPEGERFYNITGNSGMAKGGSGDVLTGILTALLSQNYTPKEASILGVWLHGKAGDIAAEHYSKEAMLPTDLVDSIGKVFKFLNS